MFRQSMCRISDSEVRNLKARFVKEHGHFVLPIDYAGHVHTFQAVATGIQICSLCGAEHVCFRGNCPEVANEAGELVCTLSGCVTTLNNFCSERNAHERTSPAVSTIPRRQRHNPKTHIVHRVHIETLYNTVVSVVHEILNSETTRQCMIEETQRANLKVGVVMGRILREMNSSLGAGVRVNLIKVETALAYTFRRLRDGRSISIARKRINPIMQVCVESIVSLIDQHGWYRTNRQLTHVPRGREFICSMLYLMRTGVTYRHRCILPKLEVLSLLLPQQVFLQKNFGIRPKCITEGENIIKLDARKINVD